MNVIRLNLLQQIQTFRKILRIVYANSKHAIEYNTKYSQIIYLSCFFLGLKRTKLFENIFICHKIGRFSVFFSKRMNVYNENKSYLKKENHIKTIKVKRLLRRVLFNESYTKHYKYRAIHAHNILTLKQTVSLFNDRPTLKKNPILLF